MSAETERITKTHVLWSMGAGLIPLPLVDIAAVTAIQVDMLNALAKEFDVEFTTDSGKALVAALTGGTIARIGASLLKGIPGVGTLLGGISMSVMSGASTYAVGQVATRHLEAHGTLFDVDINWAKQTYEREFEDGKRVAKDLKAKEGEAKTIFEKLDQLGALRDKGILTEEEFEAKKAQLLEALV